MRFKLLSDGDMKAIDALKEHHGGAKRISEAIEAMREMETRKRIPTGETNRWLEKTMQRNPPPAGRFGKRYKIFNQTGLDPMFKLIAHQLAHAIQNAEFFELACEVITHCGNTLKSLSHEDVGRLLELRQDSAKGV